MTCLENWPQLRLQLMGSWPTTSVVFKQIKLCHKKKYRIFYIQLGIHSRESEHFYLRSFVCLWIGRMKLVWMVSNSRALWSCRSETTLSPFATTLVQKSSKRCRFVGNYNFLRCTYSSSSLLPNEIEMFTIKNVLILKHSRHR